MPEAPARLQLTHAAGPPSVARVPSQSVTATEDSDTTIFEKAPASRSSLNYVGRSLVRFILAVHDLGAFALITLGVMVSKAGVEIGRAHV